MACLAKTSGWVHGGILAVLLAGCGGGGGGGGSSHSAPPGKTFGGTGEDYGFSVQQTADGGYVIAGASNSQGAGSYDAYFLKLDAAGNLIHEATFGSSGNDIAYDMRQTADGGYVITGVYAVENINPNPSVPESLVGELFVRKMDAGFSLLWEKTFSDNIVAQNACRYAMGFSVRQTNDAGYVVAGSCAYNIGGEIPYVLKLDDNGNLVWEFNNLLDGYTNSGYANAVRQASDGGYIVSTSSYLVKLDSSGTVGWVSETDDASVPVGGSAQSVWESDAGGYLITGIANASLAGDLYLAKYSADGTSLAWEKTYGSTGGDEGFAVQQTTDNGIVSVGRGSLVANRLFDVYLLKTDADGNLQWQKSFGGKGNDVGRSVVQANDNGFIVVGYTNSKGEGGNDIYVLKTDDNGKSLW